MGVEEKYKEINFSIKLVDGEIISASVFDKENTLNFLWSIIEEGWLIKNKEKRRLISPYQIKEITWSK